MSLCSMYDGEGVKEHGRPHLNLVIGMHSICTSKVVVERGSGDAGYSMG